MFESRAGWGVWGNVPRTHEGASRKKNVLGTRDCALCQESHLFMKISKSLSLTAATIFLFKCPQCTRHCLTALNVRIAFPLKAEKVKAWKANISANFTYHNALEIIYKGDVNWILCSTSNCCSILKALPRLFIQQRPSVTGREIMSYGGCSEIDIDKREEKMSLCLIKPTQTTAWTKCGSQGSDCDEGRGIFCLSAGETWRCEGLGGRCLPAET